MITFTDMFCGAGGSSIGLTTAGLDLVLAANHWRRAIDTHAANFPAAEHLCEDVNTLDKRRLPATDVLWASPICTEASPAGARTGRRAANPGQHALIERDGHVARDGFVRTRATFGDVIAATELHRYTAVLVENVPEVARKWELFFWWVEGMKLLGYHNQFVSVSSAHIGGPGNPWAPQWRDRLYMVFTRHGIPLPDVDPHPLAWCRTCGVDVAAVQAWKKPTAPRIGRYRAQYVYVCPNARCRNAVVEPYVRPASTAIDWTDLGELIGERKRPLEATTMRRIEIGIREFTRPTLVRACGGDPDGSAHLRAWPVDGDAFGTRLASNSDGLAVPPMVVPSGGTKNTTAYDATGRPFYTLTTTDGNAGAVVTPEPFITVLRHNVDATPVGEPLMTVAAQGNHQYVTTPPGVFIVKNYSGDPKHRVKPVDEPLGTVMASGAHHGLVVPYYRTGKAKKTTAPLDTVTGHDRFGLLSGDLIRVEDCRYRMIAPREALRAQRFPDTYVVTGNQGEQTMQAGNAVSANVAQWLGRQLLAALDTRSTR
jgi:DNA (cytosine-5)-methyltransferase 1